MKQQYPTFPVTGPHPMNRLSRTRYPIAFLTTHIPHGLSLDSRTRKRNSYPGIDSSGYLFTQLL